MEMLETRDVVVVGAGPAGAVAAVAAAHEGAKVLLVEANPRACSRFAGEWIHPGGARVLDRYGLRPTDATAHHHACRGFSVFPDDGSEAIRLRYVDGTRGFTCEHDALVGALRDRAASTVGVTYLPFTRVSGIDGETVTLRTENGERRVRTGRIVGADGRSSLVRRHLYGDRDAAPVSHMAGIELENVDLPFEGYGHVLLGGPGPILLYRIGASRVRACLDIPVSTPGAHRSARYLWEAFAPRLPSTLRAAFRRALEQRPVSWAANRFLPRTHYGKGQIMLVGDAVGFYHPLTASGMTIAFKDAQALVQSRDAEAYRRHREPQSYVPELLANALFQVFVRDDSSADAIRQSVYRVWRERPSERQRTMRLLGGEELRLRQFGGAFAQVALDAVQATAARDRAALPSLVEWARWPLASVAPRSVRNRYRDRSTPERPFGALPEAELGGGASLASPRGATVDVDALMARADSGRRSSAVDLRQARAERLLSQARAGELREAGTSLDAVLRDLQSAPLSLARDLARALTQVAELVPGLGGGRVPQSLEALAARILPTQLDDGSFGEPLDTALALEALHDAGLPTFHPALRRARHALLREQRADGRIGDVRTTAVAARALLATGAPLTLAAERALASLHDATALGLEAKEALALYREERATRLQDRKTRAERRRVTDADRAFCSESLLAVSRTFARPIEMLPGDLGTAVTCGYLLCRIADTVEDNEHFSVAQRDERYAAFLEALDGVADAPEVSRFEALFENVEGDPAEIALCKSLGTVLRVFRSLPQGMQTKAQRWVAEMTRGMQIYSHRDPGEDGLTAVYTLADLERYCYFVAGTVGHMLTDLFVESIDEVGGPIEMQLRRRCESFGLGLQLVNILKDVTDDRARSVSYVPRTAAARQEMALTALTEPGQRAQAHAAVAPLFERAREHLDEALEYTLTIPAEHTAVRLFCLLPLWMAARTLVHGKGNDAMFVTGEPVKIARAEVEALISECLRHVGDDSALRDRYDRLWRAPLASSTTRGDVPSPASATASSASTEETLSAG